MSKLVASVSGVVLAGVAAGIWVQHQDNAKLRRDVAGLREEVRVAVSAIRESAVGAPRAPGAAELPALNQRQDGDLAKLREEIAALRKSTQALNEFAQAAQASAALKSLGASESSIATKLTPA